MAVNEESVASDMASRTINAVNKFMDALEVLQSEESKRVAKGLDLIDYDGVVYGDGSEGSLRHVDGAALNAVLNTSIPQIWRFMTGDLTVDLGQQHDDNLQKVRS